MPIDYKNYCSDWKLRSHFIRLYRAKNRCEECGAWNYSFLDKHTRELTDPTDPNAIRIVLTTAHLDHDISNNSFYNLKAMCQRCHIHYDIPQRKRSRSKKKLKNQLKLFNEQHP